MLGLGIHTKLRSLYRSVVVLCLFSFLWLSPPVRFSQHVNR